MTETKHPTVYLRKEEYEFVDDNFDSISGGIRELIQERMAAAGEAEA